MHQIKEFKPMEPTFLSLLPPVLVLISAIITRKLPISIIFGLIAGGLIATQYTPLQTIELIAKHLYNQVADLENIYIYSFLLCVGMLIAVINYTGAARTFAQALRAKISTVKQAETTSFWISLMLSLDDYLNCLTVGHVMQPLTDSFGIARTKLAYLVHTFAGPLVVLIPISTWGAFITTQIEQAGISNAPDATSTKLAIDPFYAYIRSIPCIYYAIFAVTSALYIIYRSISYGPMRTFEQQALQNICNEHTGEQDITPTNSTLSDLLIPLGTLLGIVFFGLLYTGNYYLFGGTESLIGAFQQSNDAFLVLGIASINALILSLGISVTKKQLPHNKILSILWEGFVLMWPAVLLVILASTLGTMLRLDLKTGQYLATTLLHTIRITYIPLTFYAVAALTSSLIGTAWGTTALLLPICVPMVYSLMLASQVDISMLTIMTITIAAVLSGATFGDHTSPIAASGIMASTSAGCKSLEHIRTQFPYAVPPLIGAGFAFLATGLLLEYSWATIITVSLIIGVSITFGLIELLNKLWK